MARITSAGVHGRTLEISLALSAKSGPEGAAIRVRGRSGTAGSVEVVESVMEVVESVVVVRGREKGAQGHAPYRAQKANIATLGWC